MTYSNFLKPLPPAGRLFTRLRRFFARAASAVSSQRSGKFCWTPTWELSGAPSDCHNHDTGVRPAIHLLRRGFYRVTNCRLASTLSPSPSKLFRFQGISFQDVVVEAEQPTGPDAHLASERSRVRHGNRSPADCKRERHRETRLDLRKSHTAQFRQRSV